jgi:hypothetical protein
MEKVFGRSWSLELGTSEKVPCIRSLYTNHSTSIRLESKTLTLVEIYHYHYALTNIYQSRLDCLVCAL